VDPPRQAQGDSGVAVSRIGSDIDASFRPFAEAWCSAGTGFLPRPRHQMLVELAPNEAEDITDIDRAIAARQLATIAPKVGRNEPCPCRSGKKFKKCCEGRPRQTAS
jgi:hypothetical protein